MKIHLISNLLVNAFSFACVVCFIFFVFRTCKLIWDECVNSRRNVWAGASVAYSAFSTWFIFQTIRSFDGIAISILQEFEYSYSPINEQDQWAAVLSPSSSLSFFLVRVTTIAAISGLVMNCSKAIYTLNGFEYGIVAGVQADELYSNHKRFSRLFEWMLRLGALILFIFLEQSLSALGNADIVRPGINSAILTDTTSVKYQILNIAVKGFLLYFLLIIWTLKNWWGKVFQKIIERQSSEHICGGFLGFMSQTLGFKFLLQFVAGIVLSLYLMFLASFQDSSVDASISWLFFLMSCVFISIVSMLISFLVFSDIIDYLAKKTWQHRPRITS